MHVMALKMSVIIHCGLLADDTYLLMYWASLARQNHIWHLLPITAIVKHS